ncbi:MAG: succinate dehydrogenase [Alphaproteobacteria bacterium]|nr:succinate dehydrogenase [Alphaproteobacteria bacterium]MCB9796070.1 succinate dehydrogenase [Alphaproteobacteria bacterium]
MNMIRPIPSVGFKALMALSGGILLGWTGLHAAGNLLVFAGPETINGYGAALQGSPLVWLMRAGLLVLISAHVAAAVRLSARARAARPRLRGPQAHQAATVASRSMLWTGLVLLALLVLHILHLYGPLSPDFRPGDVFHNLVRGMAHGGVALAYVLGAGLFGLHLSHGGRSALRSLGLPAEARWLRWAVGGITLAFCLPPLAVLLGLLRP